MAVYTHLGAEDLAQLIAQYDVGELVSAKGIAEGVSNSNWLVETTGRNGGGTRFILTLYERRIDYADLPYFLDLLDHLAGKACPVPRTMHDRDGASFRMVEGKAAALIEFLPGVSPTRPTPAQARAVGEVLARLHLAAEDFPRSRANAMDFAATAAILEACGTERLATINPALPAMLDHARTAAALDLTALPQSQTHTDLFPDNVLMLGDRVTGLIDFYFACTGPMVLDLAVTHAAWCFDAANAYRPDCGAALVQGYQSVRPLEAAERALFADVAKGACLRFVASRAEDWLDTPDDALVTRKDPMQFARRWQFYDQAGDGLLA
ncbi:homoserine kinase type II [Erythromicrobium ramosum]|uniref:Homoserine kinase n=1 Tax=Erythrobacter ramosus TaxID=35811 RepID=A0A6I4UKU1_9SPHN|nr:homoserine kinase [Erythrobacter ramosus]MBB3776777.1 homoserine kinase type II [Erythrobacter ramosus]MXP39631.1 homoserine kinase [Erythrobacter ramosus]